MGKWLGIIRFKTDIINTHYLRVVHPIFRFFVLAGLDKHGERIVPSRSPSPDIRFALRHLSLHERQKLARRLRDLFKPGGHRA